MCAAKLCQPLIDILRAPELSTAAFEVEKAHHHLGQDSFVWNPTAWPGRTEIGEIPACRDQTVKAVAMAEHGLNSVVRKIVSRKERRLCVLHALPRRGSVRAGASKRAAAVRVLLDA